MASTFQNIKIHVRIFLIFMLLSSILIAGCSPKNALLSEETISVTDMSGRIVDVPKEVDEIVCIGPGALRLITYLQATDKVVGIEGGFEKDSSTGRPYIMAHPELTELPVIGIAAPSPQFNPEAIININPDVIFACYVEPRIADNLQKQIGIPVVILSYGDLSTFKNEHVFNSLKIAGKILSKTERAEAVINFIKSSQEDLTERTKHISVRPTVYVGGLGYKGTQGILSTQREYPAFEILNVKNVVNELDMRGHIFIDKEQLIQWNPDFIFVDGGGISRVREDHIKNPEFYNLLKAAQNGQVYALFPYNFYTTNIDTALANTYYIGKILYPQEFSDIDPAKKADEIYEFLVGKPLYEAMAKEWDAFKKFKISGENK